MRTFRDQYILCKSVGMVGVGEGPETEMDMAFPNQKYRDYIAKHGKRPVFNLSICKRFGGECSSKHGQCVELRKSSE